MTMASSAKQTPAPLKPKKVSVFKDLISGGVGGVCIVFVGYPPDTIKVRLQTMPKVGPGEMPLYSGMMDCLKKTISKEGVLGLYKGMAAPLAGVTPLTAMCFFGYGIGKRIQRRHPEEELSIPQYGLAGMIAGCSQTIITVPAERMKCIMQIQRESKETAKYKNSFDCLKQVYRAEGMRGIYRGTGATLLRDVPGIGLFFLTYELVVERAIPQGKTRDDVGAMKILLAGGIAGWVSWMYSIAPDTLKSRVQTAPEGRYPHGARSAFREIMRSEGPSALFRGFAPIMIRAFPANAACFLGYEFSMKFLNWLAPDW